MRVLVLNAGSSSLKAAVVDGVTGQRVATAADAGIADPDPAQALARLLRALGCADDGAAAPFAAVGHRIVHGGPSRLRPARVDAAVEADIEACVPLAPLHNPPGLALLRAARARFAALPQVAAFDTAFHARLPEAARRYALPRELIERHGLRRYGFHGINHAHVMHRCAHALGQPVDALRVISCHLGSGCSVTAIDAGRSVDTSMGFTPLEGLVMGTRAGDVDPGLLLHLQAAADLAPAALAELLHHRCGLRALAGTSDMAQVERRAAGGDPDCVLAIDVFVHRLRRYIGAMAAVLGGVDAIAFTGGIGEHSVAVRAGACATLGFLGAQLDPEANAAATVTPADPVAPISMPSSAVRLLVVAADEEREIAEDVAAILSGRSRAGWAS